MQVFNYRGKSLKDGEWVYGQLLYNDATDTAIIVKRFDGSPIAMNVAAHAVRVNKDTVCVQVGTAKNGDPVFEGDVVESASWNEYFSDGSGVMKPFMRKFVVGYKECKALLVEIHETENGFLETSAVFNLDDVSDLVVDRNMIDNPEIAPEKFDEYLKKIKSRKDPRKNGK